MEKDYHFEEEAEAAGIVLHTGDSSTPALLLTMPGYGGPHAAYISCHDDLKRRLPGRIVGVSKVRRAERLKNGRKRVAMTSKVKPCMTVTGRGQRAEWKMIRTQTSMFITFTGCR